MRFLNPEMATRINAGAVSHHDLVDLLVAGYRVAGIEPDAQMYSDLLADVRARYPTQNDVAEYLRTMLAAYARDCKPGDRH